MSHYELTFVTRSEEDNGGVPDLIAQIGGSIKHQLPAVRRKLAYPIQKETAGVYYTYEFDLAEEQTAELNKKLLRNEHILRHLLIAGGIRKGVEVPHKLKEGSLEIPESLTKGMAELAEADKKEAAAKTTDEKPAEENPATEEVVAEPAKTEEQPTTDHEATVEELTAEDRKKKLDEKLRSILGE